MHVTYLELWDFAELEPADNTTDVTLIWGEGSSMEKVFLILRRWRHMHRLKVQRERDEISIPPFAVLSDVMGMKHLSHLLIVPKYDRSKYGQLVRHLF